MNYQKVYDQIVQRATKERIERLCLRKTGEYFEGHHIIPKCLGGGNTKVNIAQLTAREHFICHWLLIRIYPDNTKLSFAFWNMCNGRSNKLHQRHIPSSRQYEEIKCIIAKNVSKQFKGRTGIVVSLETRNKMSKSANKGVKRVPRTQEVKDKISKSNTGKKRSIKTKNKISAGKLGIPKKHITEEARQNMSNAQKGRICSSKTKEKLRIINLGKTHSIEIRNKISINTKLGYVKKKLLENAL